MSLIQTLGRAARNAEGQVIMYADTITGSMQRAMDETARRRKLQQAFNEEHGIVPKTIKKDIRAVIESMKAIDTTDLNEQETDYDAMIEELTSKMLAAAERLDFEEAAKLRDSITRLKKERDK